MNRGKLISLQKSHVGLPARKPGESQLCQIEEISLLRCLGDCREKSGQFLKAWALCYTSTVRNRAEILQFLSQHVHLTVPYEYQRSSAKPCGGRYEKSHLFVTDIKESRRLRFFASNVLNRRCFLWSQWEMWASSMTEYQGHQ